jgi:Protein of unknown function (DUF1003)
MAEVDRYQSQPVGRSRRWPHYSLLAKKARTGSVEVLLNLILSCLAAIQAPLIMMSQNREEARDRLRSQSDY